MVALIKHKTITPRDNQVSTCNGRLRKARPASEGRQAWPPLRTEPEAQVVFPKDEEETKPKEVAKEKEMLGAEAEAGSAGVVEVEPEGRVRESRSRERSAYDRDTTFKLYLREIGQVKLLT